MHECNQSLDCDICPISESACSGSMCIFAEIMKTVNIGIGVFNTQSKTILYTNTCFSELLGSGRGADDYARLTDLLRPAAQPPDMAYCSEEKANQIHLNGKILGFTTYYASERKYIWIFIRDITEKHMLEAVAGAVESTNNIGYIFSGVRHEIGNPVNSIKVAVSVLKENYDTYSRATVMKYVDRVLADIGRVEYLLQALRNFNIYEAYQLVDFDLSAFMDKFLPLIMADLAKNGLQIKYEPNSGVGTVFGDQRALHQVLLNIITNAVDALEGCDDPSITISVRRYANTVRISIRDNGCGIPLDRQKNLFKPFYTSKSKGTGLGLVLSRKMLVHMNGTIEIESRKDLGTVVHITLLEEADRDKKDAA